MKMDEFALLARILDVGVQDSCRHSDRECEQDPTLIAWRQATVGMFRLFRAFGARLTSEIPVGSLAGDHRTP